MMRWERFEQVGLETSNGPGKRWGHTCNTIKGGRFVYVFGGYGKDNCQTNQVHVFDTVKQSWSQPVINGTPPTPRDSHTCTAVGDNLFVFGGTDGMNPLNDLHILDTSTHTWVCPSVRGDGPEAREGHSAALDGKRLFIFGGCGKSTETNDEEYYNDLYILNTETFLWKHATTSGTPPSARDSHTFSSWKNKLIVIGGEDGHDYYLSDVHILDAETLTWKELRTSGQKMPPRAGHSTVALGRNLFVFGGFTDAQNLYDDLYMLDVDSGLWTKVMTHGQGPSARFSVAGDILDPMKGGVLMFIGGCNKSLEALDDMYYLHTGLASIGDERRVEKLSLRKQLKLKCQEQNLNIPMHDKALVRIDTTDDFTHTIPPSYAQPSRENFVVNEPQFLQGKKVFHAKLSESFPHGYSIETIIDGKLLRGILFSNNPSQNNSRKRSGREAGVLNGEHDDKPKSPKSVKQDTDSVLPDNAQGKELTSHELQIEVGVVPAESNLNSSNASQSQEIPANINTSLPLNLNDDTAADAQMPEAAKFDAEMRTENAPSYGQTHTAEVCNHPGKSN